MEIVEVSPGVLAFVRPDEGANAGLIRTADGVVIVDTTSSPPDMQKLLDAAGVPASEARLVINTHSHGDHTWGNQLFDCPILTHRLCREKMVANLAGPWSAEAIEESIVEGEKTDPDWARDAREKLAGLHITLPTEVFDDRRELEIGGVRLDVIHFGAHTPGSVVVWLPEAKVLFAGDLIFEGRYPYLGDADVPALIAALKRLPEFGVQVIVPGHGVLCGEAEIAALVDYLETAWALTADHLAQGHTEDEAVADPDYLRYGKGTTYTTDVDLSWLEGRYPQDVRRILLVSGDRDLFVEDIPRLKAQFGAVAGDWESGAIAYVAARNNTRCLILRGVTDLVGSSSGEAYGNIQVFIEATREILGRLLSSLPAWIARAV